jgi:hypothetical protein
MAYGSRPAATQADARTGLMASGRIALMSERTIFISCGQYTQDEKALGKAIVRMVNDIPGLEAYFAEEVQDLNGLDSNILAKLHECAAFITVMHPRGQMNRPEGHTLTRASVWIEQEIAIATYIRQMENRPLPVIAFKHSSVGLEGIRTLLQLNPVEFTHESEVLAALPALLEQWKALPASGIRVELRSENRHQQEGHWISKLTMSLVNDSGNRLKEFTCEIRLPGSILKHWSAMYALPEIPSGDPHYRVFRFDDTNTGPVGPQETRRMTIFDYCTKCAVEIGGDEFAGERVVEAKVWIDGRLYTDKKTIVQLAVERDAAGA